VRRREFIALIGGAAAAPVLSALAARAQRPARVRKIAMLLAGPENDPAWQSNVAVFREGLAKLGWTSGRNLQIEYRWRMNDIERTRAAAEELLKFEPDVFLANGRPAVQAVRQATGTIPIVFTVVSEPMALGLVQSLQRPGSNVTGFTNLEPTIGGKWLELLKEIAPSITHVAVVYNPVASVIATQSLPWIQTAGQKLGVSVVNAPVGALAEIERVITTLAGEPFGGLIFPTDSFVMTNRKLVIELAARYRLPAIYTQPTYATDGGLLSYGISTDDLYSRAAQYVDRILRGESPANLPVQQPVKFELAINVTTAKALGLTVPQTLRTAADEVIE
jgi:putative ABC transport system substrate-binding protein